MLDTILTMLLGAIMFGAGSVWGMWAATRIKDGDNPVPFSPVARGGVAYEEEDESSGEDAEDDPYMRYSL